MKTLILLIIAAALLIACEPKKPMPDKDVAEAAKEAKPLDMGTANKADAGEAEAPAKEEVKDEAKAKEAAGKPDAVAKEEKTPGPADAAPKSDPDPKKD